MILSTLYGKLRDNHTVHVEDDGTTLRYVDRHLAQEMTSPRAEREGLDRTFRGAGISSMCAVGVKRRSA